MSAKVSASKPRHEPDAPGIPSEHNTTEIVIPRALTVRQLAELMGINAVEVIKDLMKNGLMANFNQVIDYDTAAIVAADLGYEAREEPREAREGVPSPGEPRRYPRFHEDDTASQKPRPPVITIMGHVDHGKTCLLDAIRQTNVMDSEVGGITQHIGAYQTEVNGQKITFLDTPGHEAFTAMRARGAQVTDIAVLVVAADDGVMPQTVEAINHARAAGVPIVVAINKIDKADANPERVKQQLTDHGLLIEEWGGDVICSLISAKKKEGVSDLLENLLLVAEMAELKANPNRQAVGAVIEAKLDNTKGPLATVLVQTGTIKVGDNVVVGDTWGKVKAMFNDKGKHIRKVEPGTPAEILGLNSVPRAGDILTAVADERQAKTLLQKRQREKERQTLGPVKAFTLDDLFAQIQEGKAKELNIVLKTDVQGSIEPINNSLERLESDKVRVRIIHSGSGNITESDVLLAIASKGIIIGFNSRPEPGAKRLADSEGVDIRSYEVIYELVEDIKKALVGMLEPTYVDIVEGHAEVRVIFSIGKHEKVVGVYVTDGKVTRGALARIIRGGQPVFKSNVSNLKRFKDPVREVAAGYECGVAIEGYNEFQIGDIIELYRKERAVQNETTYPSG